MTEPVSRAGPPPVAKAGHEGHLPMPRMTPARLSLALASAGIVALAAGASARTCACIDPPASARTASDQTMAAARLARDLVAFAREQADPHVMLAAARVLARGRIALVEADGAPLAFGMVAPRAAPPRFDAPAALAEARRLARGDADTLGLIDAFAAQADKGIVPQTLVYARDLLVGRPMVMRAQAEGGRIALVRVRSDGDARLRMSVVDESGKPACRAGAKGGEDLVCRWTPPRTGAYRIELTNDGPVWTRTILVSN